MSSTLHSARIQTRDHLPNKTSEWHNWRGIVYVCYRPKEDVTKKHFEKLQKCVKENRLTNHWGTKIFSKRPRYFTDGDGKSLFEKTVTKYIIDPTLVYKIKGMELKDMENINKLIKQ